MTTLIAPLDAPLLTLGDAGGKGANLNRMLAAGLPVPPGFVVLTAAYHRFVAGNALAPAIDAAWATCDRSQPHTFETASQQVQAAFAAAPLLPELADAITAAYSTLARQAGTGDPAVAVRSSATAEDLPDASFAGQQDTYLNLAGDGAVLAAVQRCWASLWTARAMAYRYRQQIAPADVSLAVVVQQLVPAEAAGVLFTVNPVTGDTGEVVINATWGLGEALVAGHVNPDTVVADKATGVIRHVTVGDKAIMTAIQAQGTAATPVSADRQQAQVLTPDQVAALVAYGRQLETLFAAPQDVEWARAGDTLYLLQSRAVTTLGAPPQPGGLPAPAPGDDAWPPLNLPAQPFDLWTTYDVGERWPEPVTPLTWWTGAAMIQQNMDETIEGLQAPYAGQIRWAKRAFGHVYLNEGALLHAYTDGLGMPARMIAPSLTGVVPVTPANDRWQMSKVARHAPLYWKVLTGSGKRVDSFLRDFDQIDRWVDDFMGRDLAAETDLALWLEAQETWMQRAMHYMRAHSASTSQSLSQFTQLEGLLERWTGDKAPAQKLIGGLTGIIAAEIVPTLQHMAAMLRDAGLAPIVLDQPPAAALLALRTQPAAQPMLAELDVFLRRHGHRCMSEAEWLHPRWIEAPEQVIESVAGYLRAGASLDATAAFQDAVAAREAASAAITATLNPFQRAQFRRLVKGLHDMVRARDNGQHYLVKLMLPVRRLYATLGRRWAGRGWLPTADDFFFLVTPEIEAVLSFDGPERPKLDLHRLTQARRRAWQHWFSQPMPDVLDAQGQPVAFAAARERSAEGEVLVGLAASSGTVTGTARVVLTPQEAQRIQPGEILVTRATDPGWTPVFSVIGGVVIEIGGLLSHAAIVAREYGLPAVVNIPQATQLIRDGQRLRIDGAAGRVTILE